MTRTRTLLLTIAIALVAALIPTPAHAATVGSPYTPTDNVGDAPLPAEVRTATFTNNASVFEVAFRPGAGATRSHPRARGATLVAGCGGTSTSAPADAD